MGLLVVLPTVFWWIVDCSVALGCSLEVLMRITLPECLGARRPT